MGYPHLLLRETELDGALELEAHLVYKVTFQAKQGFIVRLCLKTKQSKTKPNQQKPQNLTLSRLYIEFVSIRKRSVERIPRFMFLPM